MRLSEITNSGPRASHGGRDCSVGEGLRRVRETDPELYADLEAYFAGDPRYDHFSRKNIQDGFRAAGVTVAYHTIGRHRGKDCRCATDAAIAAQLAEEDVA